MHRSALLLSRPGVSGALLRPLAATPPPRRALGRAAAQTPLKALVGQTSPAALGTFRPLSSSASAEPARPTFTLEISKKDSKTDKDMTPKEIVESLNRHIVGQHDAKRAIAIAMRNRWRRMKLESPLKDEVMPKNILMIGPTGVGKSEVARRLAKISGAPFVKVEATKYTEVGFHGKDVDTIIKDLVEVAISLQRAKAKEENKAEVRLAVENRILDILAGDSAQGSTRESLRSLLQQGELEDRHIEVELPVGGNKGMQNDGKGGFQLGDFVVKMDNMMGSKTQTKRMKISECMPILEDMEADKMINNETIEREALRNTEENGIVFIDEIDKIIDVHHFGADASAEGVQRDLLPLIEGSAVSTRHGTVQTEHILFVCSGAFHQVKPSDLLAELQGRLPIKVELKALTEENLYQILTEPESNLIRQQIALMSTEGLKLVFPDDAIRELARVAFEINATVENIGARRLHTVLERIMEEVSFSADEHAGGGAGGEFTVTADYVRERVATMMVKSDLSRYML